MSGGYGFGIGSFLDGLADGVRAGQEMSIQNRRMEIYEEELRRKAENDAFDRSIKEKEMGWREKQQADWEAGAAAREAERQNALNTARYNEDLFSHNKSEWAYQDKERAADAPMKDAERRQRLSAAERAYEDSELARQSRQKMTTIGTEALKNYEAEKAKSIFVNKDATGKETYTVDGQSFATKEEADRAFDVKHGSFLDRYNQIAVPQIRDMYLQNGDPVKADAWINWNADKKTQRGKEISGMLLEAYRLGDWNSINKHFKSLVKNNDYMATDGYEIKAEPIVEEGKTVGLKGSYKSLSTGETFVKEFRDVGELGQVLEALTNPVTVFETNLAVYNSRVQMATKAAEKNLETAGRILEKRAEQELPQLVEYRKMLDASVDPAIRKMSPQEKDDYARKFFRSVIGGATPRAEEPPQEQGAAPAQPPLLSRNGATPARAAQPRQAPAPQPRPVIAPQPQGRSIDAVMKSVGADFMDKPGALTEYERRHRLNQPQQ